MISLFCVDTGRLPEIPADGENSDTIGTQILNKNKLLFFLDFRITFSHTYFELNFHHDKMQFNTKILFKTRGSSFQTAALF